MNMLYFDPNVRSNSPISIGDYLDKYLKNMDKVSRYMDPRYPKGLVCDRLSDHIVRLKTMVNSLSINENNKKEIERIILIHDLPETIVGDITAIIKMEKQHESQDEEIVAKKILKRKDLDLYHQFTNAETLLLNDIDMSTSENAIIAKVLDSLEGCMYFHYYLAKWVYAGNENMPPAAAPLYFFEKVLRYGSKIKDAKTSDLVNQLLKDAFNYIKNLWFDEKIDSDFINTNIINKIKASPFNL